MSNVSFFYRERWTKLQSNYGMAGSRFSRRSELGRRFQTTFCGFWTILGQFVIGFFVWMLMATLNYITPHFFYFFRFLDDLNNIIFFMALEQFWGETSWYVGSLNGMIMVLLDKANNEFLFLQVFWIGNVDAMRYQRHLRRIKLYTDMIMIFIQYEYDMQQPRARYGRGVYNENFNILTTKKEEKAIIKGFGILCMTK
ncbi:hypothetical protein GLOIN_2v1879708 [Rhizophagus irregularis DAOM 181602=DAOM 197198]|uniref:Uncharacterized protein n=1 Tax=Rhizophagus irregularis (strain DAOM 181602 / DAOM 197198 / MUCL 43194) TaxID=747089 RepID=A0A2P4PMR4_RHIID|nr:hypothetical protein GLOIN_2v1879708 [Rhizophagus irregularis DAOM 181602=DAOM 197198]POG66670.1 hypothetical protein GLOIN_2v1879708 [Rhizophagus irregularis DAOM 181602=DAOM 197198]|eukprot:XP_025173536.1 hypothetical protein GLOIN_2v1879708 [Rhizophagus irregularis DAOM 181602=DAOM 197198]